MIDNFISLPLLFELHYFEIKHLVPRKFEFPRFDCTKISYAGYFFSDMAVKWFRRTRKLVIVTVTALSAILLLLTNIANVLTYERFQLALNHSFYLNQTFAEISVSHNHTLVEAPMTLNKTFVDLQREKREELRRRYMDLWERSPEIFWIQIDRLINADGLYSEQFDVSIVTDVLKTAKILRVDAFIKRYSMKWLLTVEGGQRVLYKPANA